MAERPLRICMVSDFFHPRLGGVEMHIYQLAQCLIQRGCKVVVLTHYRGKRKGVRYMPNGLKVYYCPFVPFVDDVTLPTFFSLFPLVRKILIRERIDIVHSHQATCNLGHEAVFHAGTMGYKTVYTDHSLFGFDDTASIHLNRMLKFFLTNVGHCIAVSHACRENLVLRAALHPSTVSVIPNAVDAKNFKPAPAKRPPWPTVNIVIVSRLTYRKGVDLLVDTIPAICKAHPHVNWIVGGDGPKRLLLEEMLERERLYDRVELLGAVAHGSVRDVLARGHIFLNTSLTESFCIAIVEAASCGLSVVATDVGGVPEVLPPHMMRLAAPSWKDVTAKLTEAVEALPRSPSEAEEQAARFHAEIADMYSWFQVAERTEKVYRKIMSAPPRGLRERLLRYLRVGPISGKIFILVAAADALFLRLLEWIWPQAEVEVAHDFYLPTTFVGKDEANDRSLHASDGDHKCSAGSFST